MLRGKAISKYAVIAVACAISVLAFQAVQVFAAKNTGNFGGDYKVIKVTEQGENVEVKLSMRGDQQQRSGRERREHPAKKHPAPDAGAEPRRGRRKKLRSK